MPIALDLPKGQAWPNQKLKVDLRRYGRHLVKAFYAFCSRGKGCYGSTGLSLLLGFECRQNRCFFFCEFLINTDVDVETEYIAKKRTNRAF